MFIFYLPDWVSLTGRPGWGKRWDREVVALGWDLLCPGSQGGSPLTSSPRSMGLGAMSRALLAPFLRLVSLDTWSGFVISFLLPQCPSDHPSPSCGHFV